MHNLVAVRQSDEIPEELRSTPIGKLFEYHNLGRSWETCENAELLVVMCMDNRKYLHIPDNFAYIVRAAGANIRRSEFKISFAIGVGAVRHVAMIAHTQCRMMNLVSQKEEFVKGLVATGWTAERAAAHFDEFAPSFEIGNETEFMAGEAVRLRREYPNVVFRPILYRVEDNLLYLISEK